METLQEPAEGAIATSERRILLELTPEQLPLIETGVKLLLVIEDDRVAVHQLKELLDRVRALKGEPA